MQNCVLIPTFWLKKATGKREQNGAMRKYKKKSSDMGEGVTIFYFILFILGYKIVTEFMPGIIFSSVLRDKAEHAELLFRFTSLNILYSILWCFRLLSLKHIISQLTDFKLTWKQVTDYCLYFKITFTALKRNGNDESVTQPPVVNMLCFLFQ